MADKEFIKYIEEKLEPYGPLKIKSMFGGYGIFKSDIIFAIIADNELYFKAGKESAEFFKSNGSEPFTYPAKGKNIAMSYFKVSEEVLEDNTLLAQWFDIAYNAAICAKKNKK